MGKGANAYAKILKSHDIFVAEGVVTSRSVLGATHRVREASTRWAARTVHRHPRLHRAYDQILLRSGIARHIYGRI
jgi:hypothetical protein